MAKSDKFRVRRENPESVVCADIVTSTRTIGYPSLPSHVDHAFRPVENGSSGTAEFTHIGKAGRFTGHRGPVRRLGGLGAGCHVGGEDVVGVAVEILASPVVRIVVRGSAWRAAIWTSRRSTPASSMVVTKVCPSMCGCGLAILTPAVSASRRSRRVAAWRSIRAPRLLTGSARGWQRDEDDFGAFAAHAQHPMAVLFAQVVDVCPGGLEDAQAEEPEHRDQREVAGVR
jgi:hypothetical protein